MDFSTNYTVRTDMADEILEGLYGKKGNYTDGITFKSKIEGKIKVEKMHVERDFVYGGIKKQAGNYVTVSLGNINSFTREEFEQCADIVAEIISELLPKSKGLCLAACLGNRNLSADAIGPFTAEKIIVSRHIKQYNEALFNKMELGECACTVTGVTGETGIEAAEMLKGAVDMIKPSCVIAVDALASGRVSRLMNTVQISDSGINPGSGVNNSRGEISEKTLGVPVISVGVPTVVDASTLCAHFLDERLKDKQLCQTVKKEFGEKSSDFFVTPKDSDVYVRNLSKLIGFAINKAVHKNMSFSEMEELLS